MHRIFLIPELLTSIVSFLPPDKLPIYLLVSRYWNQTLRNNLPPQYQSLPDPSLYTGNHDHNHIHSCSPYPLQNRPSNRKLQDPKRAEQKIAESLTSLAAQIRTQDEQWRSMSHLVELGDDYFFWREGVKKNLLYALSQNLHPFICENAVELVSGLEELARGGMGVMLQTKIRRFARKGKTTCAVEKRNCDVLDLDLFDELTRDGCKGDYLSSPPVKSVEVYCVRGAEWDLRFKNVLEREGGYAWERFCVRVERDRGVRMLDVVDEMRGLLVSVGEIENGDVDVVLEWRMSKEAGKERVSSTNS